MLHGGQLVRVDIERAVNTLIPVGITDRIIKTGKRGVGGIDKKVPREPTQYKGCHVTETDIFSVVNFRGVIFQPEQAGQTDAARDR